MESMEQQAYPQSNGRTMETWSRGFLLLALGLLPVFIIPIAGFPFALAKVSVFSVLIALSAITYTVFSVRNGSFRFSFGTISRAVFSLVAAYVLSTILSQDWKVSLAGGGTETDTLLFITIAALTYLLSSLLFTTRESIRVLFNVLLSVTAIVGLFQFVRLFIGKLFVSSIFATTSTNLVGSWNDFGILMSVVLVLVMAKLDTRRVQGYKVALLCVLFAASMFLLMVVNFSTLWWLVLAAAVFVAASIVKTSKGEMNVGSTPLISRIPFASVLVGGIAVLFLIWGTTFGPKIQKIVPVSTAEAQLTSQTTLDIVRSTYTQSALTTFFGSGPNTFAQQWLLYKPASLTNSPYWTLDFSSGFSLIMTAFVTGGLVVGILYLLLPIAAALFFMRKVKNMDQGSKDIIIQLGALTVLLLGVLSFYVPGQVVALYAFALLGVLVAWLGGQEGEKTLMVKKGSVGSFILLAVCIVAVLCAGALLNRLAGGFYEGRAIAAAGRGDMVTAEAQAMRAVAVYRSEETLHLMATLKFTKAQSIAAETDKGTESTRAQRFQTTLGDASTYANAAVAEHPNHWGNWLTLAQLYEALIPLKVENAYQQSEQAYANAIQLSPRNPQLYLMAARMEATANNEQSARNLISQALTLKPNYTDAILFVVQLEIAKKNIDGALNAAAAAVQTAPDNAGLWFEVGVLAFNKGDDKLTIQALEKAIALLPDYANAKYFLGLSYYRTGRVGDAAALFEDLARKNPDNKEVAAILETIKSGKPLFAPAAPATAPVKEK